MQPNVLKAYDLSRKTEWHLDWMTDFPFVELHRPPLAFISSVVDENMPWRKFTI